MYHKSLPVSSDWLTIYSLIYIRSGTGSLIGIINLEKVLNCLRIVKTWTLRLQNRSFFFFFFYLNIFPHIWPLVSWRQTPKITQFGIVTFFGTGRALNFGILASISSSSSAALFTLLGISYHVNFHAENHSMSPNIICYAKTWSRMKTECVITEFGMKALATH